MMRKKAYNIGMSITPRSSLIVLSCAMRLLTTARVCGAEEIYCFLAGQQPQKDSPTLIREEWMNDDYCDCPFSGADEPNTSACSGAALGGWTGITSAVPSNYLQAKFYFTCPQDIPSIALPPSKLNDGICDCCDGTDEQHSTNNCHDNCADILAAQRAKQEQLQTAFSMGYQQRLIAIQKYQDFKLEVQQQIQDIKSNKLPPLTSSLQALKQQLETHEQKAAQERAKLVDFLATSESSPLAFLWKGLTKDELFLFLESVCHLAGENKEGYESFTGSSSFSVEQDCIPLMNALQEFHISCDMVSDDMANCHVSDQAQSEPEKPDRRSRRKPFFYREDQLRTEPFDAHSCSVAPLKAAFYNHAQEVMQRIHKLYGDSDTKHKRNTYDNMDDHDMDMHANDDYYPSENVDDDSISEETKMKADSRDETRHDQPPQAQEDSSEQITDEQVYSSPPSLTKDATEPPVDPFVVSLVRDRLGTRLRSLQRGARYARQSKAVMEALDEALEDVSDDESRRIMLSKIVIVTLQNSRIADADVAEVIYTIVTSIGSETLAYHHQEGVCGDAPGMPLCPPRPPVIRGAGEQIMLPPETLMESLEERCEARFNGDEVYVPGTCAASETVNIPSDASNGFHGYFEVLPRDDKAGADQLGLMSKTFLPLAESLPQLGEEGSSITDEIKRLETEISTHENEIMSKEEDAGLEENEMHSKYGPQGILFQWKDSCFEVMAGKYTYEICLFGKASQREGRGRSTSLGTFQDLKMDTTKRQWYLDFDSGEKCWNGPQRSAKVYLSCGISDRILSAEEPETCAYRLQMETPLACDEVFAEKYGLQIGQ